MLICIGDGIRDSLVNVKRNIDWANEEPDWELVSEVQQIIGDQCRVSWANT